MMGNLENKKNVWACVLFNCFIISILHLSHSLFPTLSHSFHSFFSLFLLCFFMRWLFNNVCQCCVNFYVSDHLPIPHRLQVYFVLTNWTFEAAGCVLLALFPILPRSPCRGCQRASGVSRNTALKWHLITN